MVRTLHRGAADLVGKPPLREVLRGIFRRRQLQAVPAKLREVSRRRAGGAHARLPGRDQTRRERIEEAGSHRADVGALELAVRLSDNRRPFDEEGHVKVWMRFERAVERDVENAHAGGDTPATSESPPRARNQEPLAGAVEPLDDNRGRLVGVVRDRQGEHPHVVLRRRVERRRREPSLHAGADRRGRAPAQLRAAARARHVAARHHAPRRPLPALPHLRADVLTRLHASGVLTLRLAIEAQAELRAGPVFGGAVAFRAVARQEAGGDVEALPEV